MKRGIAIKNKFQDDLIPPDGTTSRKHPYLSMDSCDFPCCVKKHNPGLKLKSDGFMFSKCEHVDPDNSGLCIRCSMILDDDGDNLLSLGAHSKHK